MADNDNVLPLHKQGRFNLGPGTAPQPATATTANRYARPRTVNVCPACGNRKPIPGEKYCKECVLAGRDNPFVECREPGCTTVAKRRYKGQQFFICIDHREDYQ